MVWCTLHGCSCPKHTGAGIPGNSIGPHVGKSTTNGYLTLAQELSTNPGAGFDRCGPGHSAALGGDSPPARHLRRLGSCHVRSYEFGAYWEFQLVTIRNILMAKFLLEVTIP